MSSLSPFERYYGDNGTSKVKSHLTLLSISDLKNKKYY